MENILEIQKVTKKFKNGRGIENINLLVGQGEVFGLLGPNGAGKTTLMKCIVSLIQPDYGEIVINGYHVKNQFELAMKSCGALISGVEAVEYLTAYENLLIVSRFYPEVKNERIDEVLFWVGMEKYKHEKLKSFSTGMRQRIYLAAALLPNPSFVILDEPTNGLDIEGKLSFLDLISRLAKEEGVTFILSTHLIEDVERICDRIAILSNGTIIGEVKKSELGKGESFESYYLERINKMKEVTQNV